MTSIVRSLVETARRGFHLMGIDIHRHRPELASKPDFRSFFQSLVALRDRVAVNDALNGEELFLEFCVKHFHESRAQLMQDLFVLYQCDRKQNGFFVEFGATDGLTISNSILLERSYSWTGVLAEPAMYWHDRLRANRTCLINTNCVWRASGETLLFNETPEREYSTIDGLSSCDSHARNRTDGARYAVQTISLLDLLAQSGAPTTIDYLSIDTEGSEAEILNAFNFDKYDVRLITVEHNYTANRERLYKLLIDNGYTRKFEALSQWDDWYVRQ